MVKHMDWSKAKTILIVAFLVTNLILGYVLLSSDKQVESTLKKDFIEDVTNLLNKKNILIDTEIPKDIPSLNTLNVEYEIMGTYDLNKNYFSGEGKIEALDQETTHISAEDEEIMIINKKIFKYKNNKDMEIYKDLNIDLAKDIAYKFLEEKKYNTADMKISYIKEENNNFNIEYGKIYKEKYLETAYTRITIDNRGIKSLERMWLNVLEEGDAPIYISTAPKAILNLLSMKEVYGKTIKDISLSYYFEPSELDILQELKDTKKGRTIPVWRVVFSDGHKVIIDNY